MRKANREVPRALLVFIDGLGLGARDPETNPLVRGDCPVLADWLERESVPVDATLGMPGLPQSATGQTALLTGLNAAREVGRHVSGFPTPALKDLIRERNVLGRLSRRGYRAVFANAYYLENPGVGARLRRQSVTTVAALAAFSSVRGTDFLLRNEAVYQDLTRESLRTRGYDGPLTTPGDAAVHLAGIAALHDFTLFEFFQTDLAGHARDAGKTRHLLRRLDEFLAGLRAFIRAPGSLFLLTSDHGNIEDCRSAGHTRNPVPLVALGNGAEHLRSAVKSLTDFVPALLDLYPGYPSAGIRRGPDHREAIFGRAPTASKRVSVRDGLSMDRTRGVS